MSLTPDPAATTAPVYISAYEPEARFRQVRVIRHDGTPIAELCSNQTEFEALVLQQRPGTDLHNPAEVHWVDRPGEWTEI
jgi:hypothetical protein